jgi:hypothetical protein
MTRFVLAGIFTTALLAEISFAQSGAVIPQGGAGHADKASCVILKRMGPADEITSHFYSFGIRGKQFQYVEGKLPDGFPFHGRLTDHDVRNLQGRGAEVIVLNQNFTSEELKQARADCRGESGTTPIQSEAKPAPGGDINGTEKKSTEKPEAAGQASLQADTTGAVHVLSTPDGADVYSDGAFMGNAPSTLRLAPGKHTVRVSASGYKDWSREITVQSGSEVKLNAGLEKQ